MRIAVGAARRQVMALVLRGGMTWAVGSIALGLTGALALSGVSANLSCEVPALDPITFTGVGATLARSSR